MATGGELLKRCPGVVGELARAIDAHITNFSEPMIALSAAFCAVGALRSGYIAKSGIDSHAYHVIIARAGLGKSRAQACIERICEACDEQRLITGDSTSEHALLIALQTYNRRVILIDEIGRMFEQVALDRGGFKQEMMSALLKVYSCASSRYYGKNYVGKSQIIVERPLVSLFGTSTHHSFFAGMTPRLAYDGMVSRMFLWFEDGESESMRASTELKIPQALIDEAALLRDTKTSGNLHVVEPVEMRVPARWDSVIHEIDLLVRSKRDTLESAVFARYKEQFIKLCLALCDSDGVLDTAGFIAAQELIDYLIDDTLNRCREHLGQTDNDIRANSLAGQILKYIEAETNRTGVVTSSAVCRKFQRAKARDLALQELVDQERVFRIVNGRQKWYTTTKPELPDELAESN